MPPRPSQKRLCLALSALLCGACAPPPEAALDAPSARLLKNRLADAPSPYLRRAAEQPIPWQTWGDDALMLARALNRPLFVSVGYGACHWCQVMAETTLADPEVISALRDDFVPVKVDRDLEPELDARWQPLLVSLTGQGGWPLHVWLTPSGEPFHAAGYAPARGDAHGPGFLDTLRAQAALWREDPARVQTQARRRAALLAAAARPEPAPARAAPAPPDLRAQNDAAMRVYDPVSGGRRGAPKQPFGLPLEDMLRDDRPPVVDAALHSLTAYATGALRDPVGGGFHRYCVDAEWRAPHFEKLTADNARLVALYLRAAAVAPDDQAAALHAVAAETLDALLRPPLFDAGRVAVAVSARSFAADGRLTEGGATALSAAQVQTLAARVPGLALAELGLDAPALSDGRFVPRAGLAPSAPARRAIEALRADRAALRPSPVDPLSVLGDQARVLSVVTRALWTASPDEAARWAPAAEALRARLVSDLSGASPWPRAFSAGVPVGEATLTDALAVGHALVDVFERHGRLDALTLAQRAAETAQAFAAGDPSAQAWVSALQRRLSAPADAQVLVVAAAFDAPEARALLAAASPASAPDWTRLAATQAQLAQIEAAAPWTQGKGLRDGRPTAWVCTAGRCLPPIHDAPALRTALRAAGGLSPAAGRAD